MGNERTTPGGPDFEAVFASLPVAFMILDRELRLVGANQAYLAVTGARRTDVIGRYVFDAFPEAPERVQRFRDAFERALAGEENVVAMAPFSIPSSAGPRTIYWSCTHTPVRNGRGEVTHVIQQAQDVTALVETNGPSDGPGRASLEGDVVRRAVRIEALSQALRAEGEYLKSMFKAAPGFMCVLSGKDLIFELANDAFLDLVARPAVLGESIREVLPELAGQGIFEMLERIVVTGEPFHGRDFPLLLRRSPDEVPRRLYVDFVWQPVRDEDGRVLAVFVQGSDVTERVLATEQQRVLLDEVNHRVKNTLATVQAMVAQTLKSAASREAFAEDLLARLTALSATHNLLTSRNWSGAGLRELVLLEVKPFGADRVDIDGTDLVLSPRRTTNMGLVFHELATNAAKYGALSVPGGRVTVRWKSEGPGTSSAIVLDWIERGGPPVSPPRQKGFGTRLIDRTIKAKPGASYTVAYEPEGLHWQVRLPAE